MPDQVSNLLKTERSDELFALEQKHSVEFRAYYVGREVEVLLEEEKEVDGVRYMLGHTSAYVKVAVPVDGRAGELQSNRLVRCMVQGFLTDEILLGEQY